MLPLALGELGSDALLLDLVGGLLCLELGLGLALFGLRRELDDVACGLRLALLQLAFLGERLVADDVADDLLRLARDLVERRVAARVCRIVL